MLYYTSVAQAIQAAMQSGTQSMLRRSVLAFAALAVSSNLVFAGEVGGEWARTDGKGRVRFAPCGDAMCGTITWLKDSTGGGKIGQRVFFDMKPNGENIWAGTAFNPEDGKEYAGKLTLSGNNLVTAGCALGGLICKSVSWTRVH
jgi:uncharacterized protein (DUF2147 family)